MRLIIPFLFCFVFPWPAQAAVYISELQWAGSDVSTSDEWLELAATETTDLSGWSLTWTNGSGVPQEPYVFPAGTVLESGQIVVLARQDATVSRLSEAPFAVVPSLSLLNTKLIVWLKNGSGEVVDQADDGSGAPMAGSNTAPKATMERVSAVLPGSDPLAWQAATLSRGFDEGSPLLGTPGFVYSVAASSASQSSSSFSSSQSSASFSSLLPLLQLSELLSDPPGDDADGQWIEVRNASDATVSLAGWSVAEVMQNQVYAWPSDAQIGPGQALRLARPLSRVALRRAGGVAELRQGTTVRDRTEYPLLASGVSWQRDEADQWRTDCVPSPGSRAVHMDWSPFLEIQSGTLSAEGPHSLNLAIAVLPGQVAPVECTVAYGDGSFESDCTPNSHAYDTVGRYRLQVDLLSACGDRASRHLTVEVLPKQKVVAQVEAASSVSSSVSAKAQTSRPSIPALVPLWTGKAPVASVAPSASVHSLASQPIVQASTGVVLVAALPNPLGADAGSEWAEVQNITDRPLDATLFALLNAAGKRYAPTGTLFPGQTVRWMLPASFTLKNTGGSVTLVSGPSVVSELRWASAKQGQVVHAGVMMQPIRAAKRVSAVRSSQTKRARVVVEGAAPALASGALALLQRTYAAEATVPTSMTAASAASVWSAWGSWLVIFAIGLGGGVGWSRYAERLGSA